MLAKVVLAFATSAGSAETKTSKGSYVDVNGTRMYFEIHGRGEPLIVLDGAFMASEGFGVNRDAFAKNRQVIAVHLQGHGNTRDRPLRYEQLADDVAVLVGKLKLKQVDVIGWSFGGGTAIQFAIRHPKLVRKLVVVGQPMSREGWYPEVNAVFPPMAKDPKKFTAGIEKSELLGPTVKKYPHIDGPRIVREDGRDGELGF